jgi:hypothetical protein
MWLGQLNVQDDRGKAPELWADGDLSDLFGVKITGQFPTDVRGVKCLADSSVPEYRFPVHNLNSDPRFLGALTPARVEPTTARVISGWGDFFLSTPEEILDRPILVENDLGRGKAFLISAWEYPADEGMRRLSEDVLRTVLQGQQGEIRVLANQGLRYAVYDNHLSDGDLCHVIYLLNTDPDCDASVRLWVQGRKTERIVVEPGELRVAYRSGHVVLVPTDKCIDIRSWTREGNSHQVEFFSARGQDIEVHNLADSETMVSVNAQTHRLGPRQGMTMSIDPCVDLERADYFAPDFLDEPALSWSPGALPY